MERAPLRPVPGRPPGPVDPDAASRHVVASLPALDEPAAAALALVALAGRTRPEAAARTGLAEAELAEALARARKALRRASFPLPGSGWCERAERLVSDRLDDALEPPGPARLDAHLRNCPRCVEHERRLVQATDALVAGFVTVELPPAVETPAVVKRPLSVVRPERAAPPAVRPFGEPIRPAPARIAKAAAKVPPAPAARSASALAWNVLFALAVVLTVAALALAVAGALGTQL